MFFPLWTFIVVVQESVRKVNCSRLPLDQENMFSTWVVRSGQIPVCSKDLSPAAHPRNVLFIGQTFSPNMLDVLMVLGKGFTATGVLWGLMSGAVLLISFGWTSLPVTFCSLWSLMHVHYSEGECGVLVPGTDPSFQALCHLLFPSFFLLWPSRPDIVTQLYKWDNGVIRGRQHPVTCVPLNGARKGRFGN